MSNEFLDKNGRPLEIGDDVICDADETTMNPFEFSGVIVGFHNNFVTVQDMDGDCFDFESHQVELF